MKTIFTLLLASVFTTSAFAYDEGRISISIPAGKATEVYIDDRPYKLTDNSILIDNVQTGNHSIKVYSRPPYNSAGNKGRGNRGNSRNNQNNQANLVYSSTVYVRPSYHVDVVINRFGKALVDERALDNRNDGWNNDNDGWNDGGYGNGNRAISDQDFNQLIQKVKNQWLGKLGAARDAINANYFQTYQVRQLIQLFNAESEKLELAKLSYSKIVDRQNFRQLYDLLSRSSQTELDRYTQQTRY